MQRALCQTAPTITWATPSPIVYGVALSATQLNATANVAGTFSYSPAASTVLVPGSQTLTVTFTPNDTTDYSTATATVTLNVLAIPPAGLITTYAGGTEGYGGAGGPAVDAAMQDVDGVAIDSTGNVYLTDLQNSAIDKVTASTGIITTIAGNGTAGYSGNNGPAINALISWPRGISFDRSGNIYFADSGNDVIRKISSSGIITTVAGDGTNNWGYSGDGGPATSARFSGTVDVAVDSAGNLYIADSQNMVVRKVWAATGIITTIAGNGTAGYTGDGGPATSAELNWPYGVAVDPEGDVYIGDMDNNAIRRVDASTGVITTVAGNGTQGYSGDSGPAVNAELYNPIGVTLDAAGNLYFCDSGNNVVREVAVSSGSITTVAGNGTAGYMGDGGPATSANLNTPWGVRLDSNGNLFIAEDGADRVRVVGSSVTEPVRTMPTITWPNPSPISYGSALSTTQLDATASVSGTFTYSPAAGAVLPAGSNSLSVLFTPNDTTDYSPAMATVPITVTPVAPTVTWSNPAPIVFGAPLSSTQLNATANVPGTFAYTPNVGTVLQPGTYTLSVTFTPADTAEYSTATDTVTLIVQGMPGPGIITTVAGTGVYAYSGDGGLGINADLEWPEEIAVDSAGNVYIPDFQANVVRKLTTATGIITTIAGTGTQGYSGDGGPATSAQLNNPDGVAVDAAGNVYIDDYGDNRIRKLTVSTGIITTVAGTGTAGYTGDGGPATSAELTNPGDVLIDASGNLYIADTWNQRVREVLASSGTIVTVAGNGDYGYSGDGGPATSAQLNAPVSIALDGSGNLYIADAQNNVIRKVTASTGIITTIAGNGAAGYTGDGGAATSAELNSPSAVAVDSAGNVFIADYSNFAVREVSAANGNIMTVAGNGTGGYSGDGGPATSAELNHPHGVAVDSEGNVYIGDCGNARVRVVGGASPIRVSVNPTSAVMYPGQREQFVATVTGTGNTAVTWSISPSNLGAISSSGDYTAPASISAQQTVTVTATSQADTTKSASAVVTLLPTNLSPSLSLAPSLPSPYVADTSEQFLATLKTHDGVPVSEATVNFTVTGANPSTGTGTTDSNGVAAFTYTGANEGSDTIQATATSSGYQISSNTVSATWLTPSTAVSTTTITGQFFVSDGSGKFDITSSATPVFTETFPTIDFNPPSGTVPGAPSSINYCSRPFTDVTTDINGNYTGSIVAQGNGYQAGGGPNDTCTTTPIGNLFDFHAVFRGSFTVASAGNVTFNFYSDDGFIFGIGNGATRVSGASTNMPSVTPFAQYPTMGANNQQTAPSGSQIVVNFPAPGSYPYELDYTECCGGQLVFTMTQGATSPTGIPPTGSLTLSPNSLQPLPQGGQQTFTVLATDAAGNPVSNLGVSLVVSGADNLQLSGTTDSTGHAAINYKDVNPGTATVQAVGFISGMVAYSNQVTVPWTGSPPPGTGTGANGTLSVSASAPDTVVLPNTLTVTATATDSSLPSGDTISTTWSEVSGPGSVTFANPQQLSTSASFSAPGTYALELSASDVNGNATAQIQVTVDPQPGTTQGWFGSPLNGSAVSGVVPITLASGVTMASGTLGYYPANSPNSVTVLNADTTGSGQIGTLDTTALANGSYWITLQGTTTSGASQYNLILVTVTGNNKPGRVTTTVTDLVVPVNGLPIKIQRTYDSLNANTVGDFGYGWKLGTNVDLTVGPMGSVTFTLNGQRKTFYLTPSFGGWLFPWYFPAFTPEPGLFGTLTPAGSGCSDLLDFLVPDGNLWACIGGGFYTPPGYVYTDPTGTSFTMTAQGQLQSIVDKNGNALTIGAGGISSSSGLSVTFARDSQGRIATITDPQSNVYHYSYDTDGNLASVTYPPTTTSLTCPGATAPNTAQYSYYPDSDHPDYPAHYYAGGTDANCHQLPMTTYYTAADTDPNGLPLNDRLESVTDALGQTTSYVYNLETNTTTITYPDQGKEKLVYDSYGDLTSDTDPLGHVNANTYDANHNLASTTDRLGNITCYTYDSNGNRTSTTVPQAGSNCSSTMSTTTYNQFSEPTQTKDELGNVRTFNYDVNLNPLSVTDSLGTLASFVFNPNGTMAAGAVGYDISAAPTKASTFAYDVNGNMTGRTDALGRATFYGYNSLGQKTSMTAPPQTAGGTGATTNYNYDAFGNLTETDAPLSRTTKSQYDGNGNKIQDKDALGHVTGYQYDALNRLIETDYPDGTKATKSYDFRGNVIDENDQAGHVTHHVYDLAGRLTSVTYASGTGNATTVSYAYDNDGRKTSETDSLGHATSYTYDAAGNLLSTSGVKGNFTYTYDNARNRKSMKDGDGNTTTYVYDARKRLIETDYQDGTKKTYAYDGPGNLTLVTDQAGNQVQYSYDAANQLANVVELNSPNTGQNTTVYGYDGDGNPIAFEDANTHTTSESFDLLNELTGTILPDNTLTETRTYDSNGNLQTVLHFNGVTTTYTYDTLNRLLSRSTPGEPTVNFTYTATGKRQTMTDASGETTYNYDNMDRLSSKVTPEGTLSYTYDAAGNLQSIASSNANGASMSYTYDSLNRVSSVTDKLGTTNYTYDGASNLYTATYPNSVEAQYQYDALNRLSGLATEQSGFTYQRGPTGNLTNASELNGRQVTWSFDGIYRLSGETISGDPGSQNNGSVGYDLDPVGNRDSVVSSLGAVSSGNYSYNADDELSSETYDQDGNVTAANGKTFTYDSQNELVSMNGGAVQVLYDGDGNRVAKAVTSGGVTTTTYYLVDDLNPTGLPQVMDELTNGVVTRTYTYGLQRIDEDQIVNGAWTPSFYSYDGMGSVRQLTNVSGAVTDTYEYDAFGNQITHTGTTSNNYLYRGEQWDSDLGLYYLRARYYDPTTGRFMSRDPNAGVLIIPQSLHKYLYAAGDAVNRIDPRGRADLFEYAIRSNAAIPESKLISIYGCVADASLTAVDLILNQIDLSNTAGTVSTGLGAGASVIGCVVLVPGLNELAEAGAKATKASLQFIGSIADWGSCALDVKEFVNDLNDEFSGTANGVQIADSVTALAGCVGDALGYMVDHPGKALQGIGLE